MHTPAPSSLWLVPGRAPLTRGECGEDGEEQSRGGEGRGGQREPRPEGAWSRRLLEGAAAAAGG